MNSKREHGFFRENYIIKGVVMKVIKSIYFLSMFGLLVHASDDDSDNRLQTNDGRVSPHGLYPVATIPSYTKKYGEEIAQLEKKMSQRQLQRMQHVPLVGALEDGTDGAANPECPAINQVAVAKSTDEDDKNIESFRGLCRKVSSMKKSCKASSGEESELYPVEDRVNHLRLRLAIVRRENNIPPSNLDGLDDFLLLDSDQGVAGAARLDSAEILGELEKEGGVQVRLELEQTGLSKKGSLHLEIPKALSFKYVQDQAAAAAAFAVVHPDPSFDKKYQHELFGKRESSDTDDL
jgi:hypothetical protein